MTNQNHRPTPARTLWPSTLTSPTARPDRPPGSNSQPAGAGRPPDRLAVPLPTRLAKLVITVLAVLVDLVLPIRCAGCGERGIPICLRCAATFAGPFPVRRPGLAHGPPAFALAEYQGAARTALLAYKERGRRDLAGVLGRTMAAVLPWLPGAGPDVDGTWWLVPAPSRATEARRRGGWHLVRLARAVACALAAAGHPAVVAPALRLAGPARDSVGLTAAARAANLAGRIRLRPEGSPPRGTPVILLDDVIASGATATACAAELTAAGLNVTAVLTLTAV